MINHIRFANLGSIGLGKYDFDVKTSIFGADSEQEFGIRFGLGLQYNINDNLALRGMARYVDLASEDVDNMTEFSVGLRYSF